jgi:trigger factor
MAQAQVEETGNKKGLTREFAIKVPQDIVEKNLTAKLAEIGKSAKLPGFRPGKVPMDVLRQRYGQSARAEVLDQTISETVEKTLSERKLRPAMQPKVEPVTLAENADLEFKLAVEVLPEITPADFGKIAIERPVAEITDKMIEEAIARAAKAMREPVAVEGRAAKKGDVLIIDFEGSVDGKSQPGMKGENHKLELGSKSFIDTFEDQLAGSKPGETKTLKVTFPENYHSANLSGKKAEFVVTVKEVREHKPAEMNDELAKELGFPGIDKLRERVRDDLAADYARISRAIVKRQLMDKLAAAHSFDVPPGLLENEFNAIWKQVEESKAKGELPEEDKKKSDEALRKEYHAIAERRIRLGLLLSEVAQQQKIDVAPNDLRNALMAEARRFPGQEKTVIEYYTQTPGALERIRAPLLEEKVVDYITGQAKVTDKVIAADDLLKKADEE